MSERGIALRPRLGRKPRFTSVGRATPEPVFCKGHQGQSGKKPLLLRGLIMSFENDLRRVAERVAEARRTVQQQKGLLVRLRAAGVNTLDAQRILWLLESKLWRLEQHRDHL